MLAGEPTETRNHDKQERNNLERPSVRDKHVGGEMHQLANASGASRTRDSGDYPRRHSIRPKTRRPERDTVVREWQDGVSKRRVEPAREIGGEPRTSANTTYVRVRRGRAGSSKMRSSGGDPNEGQERGETEARPEASRIQTYERVDQRPRAVGGVRVMGARPKGDARDDREDRGERPTDKRKGRGSDIAMRPKPNEEAEP